MIRRVCMISIILCLMAGSSYAETARKPFRSKIGVHLIGSYTPGSQKMVRARMPVLKILDLHQPMIDAARDYKAHNPDGIVVLRCYTPVRYTLADDPIKTADKYWNTYFKPQIDRLSKSDRKLVDYIEATNEMGECPTWENDESIRWFTRFSIRFVKICSEAGYRPCLASIPVGNPGGGISEVQAKIRKFALALRTAKRAGGAWSYHSYTIKYSTDPGVEYWYSLRYRMFYAAFKGPYADLANMPMILTEGGVDYAGNRDTDGWSARGTADQYKAWLKWFDSEIAMDPYIMGITLFQNGDPQWWKSFDLEPLADWFAEYWG
ncbi:MAG: hypothetical protein ACYC27_09345 [Armatimonadota bacterium]